MARDDEKDEGTEKIEETLGTADATPDAEATADIREAEDGEAPSPVEAKPRTKGRSRKARRSEDGSAGSARQRAKAAPAKSGASRLALVAVLALASGLAMGWFGHEARAKALLREPLAPAAEDANGACKQWEGKICAGTGDESAICQQAKGAAELLTSRVCENALAAVPATLAKAKAARASCDTLIKQACDDLPQGSSTCKMVQERTGSFPVERCKTLLENYEQVRQELQAIEAQGGPAALPQVPGMPPQ
jgi:hypothetical protein